MTPILICDIESSMLSERLAIQRRRRALHEQLRALSQKLGVEMPLTAMVHRVLYEDHSAAEAVVELMTRGLRHELE